MNLGQLLKAAPGLQISAACWLFLQLAPQVRWMPSELNSPVASVGIVAALVAVVLPLADVLSAARAPGK